MKISDVLADTKSWLENMAANEYTGIRSGFTLIDTLTRGFNKSEMTLIAGRPSMGKTTFALNMAANIAFRQELPAAFFSPEVSSRMLAARLLAAESAVDFNTMTSGLKPEREKWFNKINDTISHINNKPLFIEDIAGMKLPDICARAREIHRKEKIEIIFIDSIDLILTPHGEQTQEIARSIKELARELNIPVVVMSQMRRSGQRIRPRLSYVRYPSLGIYADVVFLLHRERDTFKASVTIAKNRSGPLGIIELAFYPKWYRFEEVKSP